MGFLSRRNRGGFLSRMIARKKKMDDTEREAMRLLKDSARLREIHESGFISERLKIYCEVLNSLNFMESEVKYQIDCGAVDKARESFSEFDAIADPIKDLYLESCDMDVRSDQSSNYGELLGFFMQKYNQVARSVEDLQ